MKTRICLRWYRYRSVGFVIVIYLALLLWIKGNLLKSTSETEQSSVDNLNLLQRRDIVTGRKVFLYKPGRLPNWDSRSLMTNATNTTLNAFRQTLSKEEFLTLKEILRALKSTCEENDLTYMLYGGSVIGAYRHAGLIPWDDDVDIWMDVGQMEKSLRILSKIPGHSLHHVEGKKFLLKLTRAITIPNKSQKNTELFPFVHIIFFIDNSTHIRDSDTARNNRTVFPKSDIFPLKKAMFEDEEHFVPNDMLAVIRRKYAHVNLCTPRTCSNLTVSVPCDKLYNFYPFLTRTHRNNTPVERLEFGGKVIWERVSV